MKRPVYFLTAILLSLSILVAALPNAATAATTIGVVDIKMIVNESLATKHIRKQVESKHEALREEVAKLEETLRQEDQELAKQRTVLSQDAWEEKAKAFKTRYTETQRDVQSKKNKLERAYAKALSEVQATTIEIIEDLADDKGFSIAIPKSQILFSEKSLDISKEVLKRLDKKLPKIEVEVK